jgi:hypothetical protein
MTPPSTSADIQVQPPGRSESLHTGDSSRLDPLRTEQALRAAVPEAVFAAPATVRRIIRADLDLPLLRPRIPHRDGIVLPPGRLLELADDVWALPPQLPERIVLLARPDPSQFADRGQQPLLREYWRRLFHGCVDLAARELLEDEATDGPEFRDLINRIGETAWAEAQAVLGQESLLRDPHDRREAMAEFIAVVLELAHFSPHLLPVWFPAIEDHPRLVELCEGLVSGKEILARTRPPAAANLQPRSRPSDPQAAPAPWPTSPPGRLTRRAATFIRRRAVAAARRGNDVRAALLFWRLRSLAAGDASARDAATRSLAHRLARLARRLDRAVGSGETSSANLRGTLDAIVEQTGGSAWSPAARLLYDLQKACVDSEREGYRTQLLSWAFTRGRVPLMKPLPLQRVALVHRHIAAAFRRLPRLVLPPQAAEPTAVFLGAALEATEQRVRDRLGPPIRASLKTAGLVPTSLVEEAGFDTLVDELLDSVVHRGFESFGNVRDAVSRNQVKLPDLQSFGELLTGDPLLQANSELADSLDGAYRRAPAYLLAMQRLSAPAFGLPLGRALTLHLLLPFGGAWVIWRGLEHIVEPITHYSLGEPWHIYSRSGVLATGVAIWLLMHVPTVRRVTFEALHAAGALIHLSLIVLPQRVLALPVVERFLRSRLVRLFRRYLWSPLVLSIGIWLVLPHGGSAPHTTSWGWFSRGNPWLAGIVFAANSVVLNSPTGRWLQEQALEGAGRLLHQLHVHLIAGLLSWIVDVFQRAVDFVEGMLYAVDEQLRFRTGESRLTLAVKAVLTTIWSVADWFMRFCITLLIEPQLNPIKHFPVVTVSHKLLVPMIPMVAANLAAATGLERRLALTAVTFVSTAIPGVFGFLAWELKENWRLYAANRPRLLAPVQVGHHGETIRRLLLPGFHSGTIPKLFARLRRQLRSRGQPATAPLRAEEQLVELGHDIAAFVDDECLGLLRRSRFGDPGLRVAGVRLATNRITVEIAADQIGPDTLRIEFIHSGGTLLARRSSPAWLASLSVDRQQLVGLALDGLDALGGADFTARTVGSVLESAPVASVDWVVWRAAWQAARAEPGDPPEPHGIHRHS